MWPGEREKKHRKGQGARLTQVAVEKGIDFDVVLRVEGDRTAERKLKDSKNLRRVCPVCAAEYQRQQRESKRQRRESQRVFAAIWAYVLASLQMSGIILFMLTAYVFSRKGGVV